MALLPVNRSKLYAAALERLIDAERLLENKRYTASVYMAGYAVEMSVKSGIARRNSQTIVPEEHQVHDLADLVGKTNRFTPETDGMWSNLQKQRLTRYFDLLCKEWNVNLRYSSSALSPTSAKNILNAARMLVNWANGL